MVRRTAFGARASVSYLGVEATLNQIQRFPRAGAPVPRVPRDLEVRQAPIKGFPYHVVYLETADTVHILAFAHDKRRPAYWLPRSDADTLRGG